MFCASWELPQALLWPRIITIWSDITVAEAVGMCYAKGAERRVCMGKCFNIIADCKPQRHFMVNIDGRLRQVKEMVERGDYFMVNRARQYGKTTMLKALACFLAGDYTVLSLDFQQLSHSDFETEHAFVKAFARMLLNKYAPNGRMPADVLEKLRLFADEVGGSFTLGDLFGCFGEWCQKAAAPLVLMVDEVDNASNNQIFLDFLARLRNGYIERDEVPAFQSVILAGVYDIKNLKRKFAVDSVHNWNSPWNIAVDFSVDMSFSTEDISGMLQEYESVFRTGMDLRAAAGLIYDYTAGYPYLVSYICKMLDEQVAGSAQFPDRASAWTREGIVKAVGDIMKRPATLFDDMKKKLEDYRELRNMLYAILFQGREFPYNPDSQAFDIGTMFGFLKESEGMAVIANRMFEMRMYNYFLSEDMLKQLEYSPPAFEKNQFIKEGMLDMDLVMQKFLEYYTDVWQGSGERFLEENGRRLFLLFLRPIINGVGNYYIESQTRNATRTDVIIDYRGRQYVIEMKIYHGDSYNRRGEEQLADYLETYHLEKGYLLSFNFNKNKEPGIKTVICKGKTLLETMV